MQWVPIPDDQCDLKCPPLSGCMRPEELTEPIYCVHHSFKLPHDFTSDPHACNINFSMVGIGLIVMLQLFTLGWIVAMAARRFYRSGEYILPEARPSDENSRAPTQGRVGVFYDVSLGGLTSTV